MVKQKSAPGKRRAVSKKAPQVLIYEEDTGYRQSLARVSKKLGLRSYYADTPAAVTALLRQLQFALIIADIRHPFEKDFALLQLLKKSAHNSRVLILSTFDAKHLAAFAAENDAWNYLAKPVRRDELIATIRKTTGLGKPDTDSAPP